MEHAEIRVPGTNVGQVAKVRRQLIERDGRKDSPKSGIRKRVETTRGQREDRRDTRPAGNDMIFHPKAKGGGCQYRCDRRLPTRRARNQKRNRSGWEGKVADRTRRRCNGERQLPSRRARNQQRNRSGWEGREADRIRRRCTGERRLPSRRARNQERNRSMWEGRVASQRRLPTRRARNQ